MSSEGFWGLRASWNMRRRREVILLDFCCERFGLLEDGGGVVVFVLRCGSRGRWSWRCADSILVQSIRSISQAHGVGMRPLIYKRRATMRRCDAMLKMMRGACVRVSRLIHVW